MMNQTIIILIQLKDTMNMDSLKNIITVLNQTTQLTIGEVMIITMAIKMSITQ